MSIKNTLMIASIYLVFILIAVIGIYIIVTAHITSLDKWMMTSFSELDIDDWELQTMVLSCIQKSKLVLGGVMTGIGGLGVVATSTALLVYQIHRKDILESDEKERHTI